MYESIFCKVQYLEEKNAILCEWKQFCHGEDYREPFYFALELIKVKQIHTWITDTTNGFENEEVDTQWLLEEYMPQLIQSSVKKIVFIIGKESLLMNEIEEQVQSLKDFFDVELLESLDV